MTTDTNKRSMLEILRADMHAMQLPRTDILSMMYCCLRSPGFLAILLFRLSTLCTGGGVLKKAAALFLWRLNIFINVCEIDPRAKIGEGFALPHPAGVIIGPVVMGRNVTVLQNVTMGAQGGRGRVHDYTGPESRAQVGDDVIFYAGAIIAGGIKIGSGATIGANAVVRYDVPENSTAVGVPARILEKRSEPKS